MSSFKFSAVEDDIIILDGKKKMTEKQGVLLTLRYMVRDMISKGKTRLVLDMSRTDLIDPNMTREFLNIDQETHRQGGALVLTGVKPSVRKKWDGWRLGDTFTIVSDPQEAIQRFNRQKVP